MVNMAEPNKSRDAFCPLFNSEPLGSGGRVSQRNQRVHLLIFHEQATILSVLIFFSLFLSLHGALNQPSGSGQGWETSFCNSYSLRCVMDEDVDGQCHLTTTSLPGDQEKDKRNVLQWVILV